jgi:hypothetical protein
MRKAKEAANEALGLLDQVAAATGEANKTALEEMAWDVIKGFLGDCVVEFQHQIKTRNAHSDAAAIAIFREFDQRWLGFLNRLTGKVTPKFQDELRDEFKFGAAFVVGVDIARRVWPTWVPTDEALARLARHDQCAAAPLGGRVRP